MKRLILIFTFLSNFAFGQKPDSLPSRQLSLFGGIQAYNRMNGGSFYTGNNFSSKNNYYNRILSIPMASIFLGIKYNTIYQELDYSHKSRSGFYQLDLGSDSIFVNYFSYQIWSGLLNKPFHYIQPLVSFNFVYIHKTYVFDNITDWANGSSIYFKDFSKTLVIQMPIGIYWNYKHLLLSTSYNLSLISIIKGSYQKKQISYCAGLPCNTTFANGEYSNNSVQKQKNTFSIKIAYSVKL